MVAIVLHNRIERLRKRRTSTPDMVLLPAMSTDLETVLDALDLVAKRWQEMETMSSPILVQPRYEFLVASGEVTRKELADLSVHERNSLTARVRVGVRLLEISCPPASVCVAPEGDADARDVEYEVLRVLLQGRSWRPSWRRVRTWMPLLPAFLAVVGIVWGVIASGFHPAALLTGVGAGVLLVAFAWKWSGGLRRVVHGASGPIRFHALSRKELYASRADRLANFKVALITAPVSIAVALFIAWATGFISPKT